MKYDWLYAQRLNDAAFAKTNNELPWERNKEDFQFFINMTRNKNVVCTAGTFYSITRNLESLKILERFNRTWIVLENKELRLPEHIKNDIKQRDLSKETIIIGGQRAFYIFSDPTSIYLNLLLSNIDDDIKKMSVSPQNGFSGYEIKNVSKISDKVCNVELGRR